MDKVARGLLVHVLNHEADPFFIGIDEKMRASGKELLTGVVVGYETSLRVGLAIMPTPQRKKQVWGFGTWQIVGAVTAASRFLKFDREQMSNAIGLACANAPIPCLRKSGLELEERPKSWPKANYGWAAMGGVLGAMLTQKGFIGNRFILDGERGFWEKREAWREWSRLSEGCYMLGSNIQDWSAEELWKAYIQLTEAEEAFRIHKSDLSIRPIWHQKEERVRAHILVCFLAYVLWKTLGQLCRQVGLGNEPRKVFWELSQIKLTDVILPTRNGTDIRLQCVETPTNHQMILLQRLKFYLPQRLTKRNL